MPRTLAKWSRRRCARCPKRASANADRRWRTRSSRIARRFRKRQRKSWSCWLGSICNRLLDYCLRGEQWPSKLLDEAIAIDDGREFLSVVVERLGDLFEPRLDEVYRDL